MNPTSATVGTRSTDLFLLNDAASLTAAGTLDGGAGLDALIFTGDVTLNDGHFAGIRNMEGMMLGGTGAQSLVLGAAAAAAFTGRQVAILADSATSVSIDGTAMPRGSALLVTASEGGDRLLGGAGNDILHGNGGDDLLQGGAGDDSLWGDAGNDQLSGGAGADRLRGGDGDDTVLGGDGNDDIRGNEGNDILHGDAGDDIVWGGVGNDTVTGGKGIDILYGGEGTDRLYGDGGADTLIGDQGNDDLYGGAEADRLEGGDGSDRLDGGAGADTLLGGLGDDRYIVDNAGDVVSEAGGGGTDTVVSHVSFTLGTGLEGLTLSGGSVLTGTGNDLNNRMLANNAGNTLDGLAGNDALLGGAGSDTLIGGLGADKLSGGAGADRFRYASAAEGGDAITDFASGTDRIEISATGFGGGLVAGTDATGHFTANTTGLADAPAGTGQFVFETDTARLWWDADGSGGVTATQIASFAAGTALAASDLQLIG